MKSLKKEVITIAVLLVVALVGAYVVSASTVSPVLEQKFNLTVPDGNTITLADENCIPCEKEEGLAINMDDSYLLAATYAWTSCNKCSTVCHDNNDYGYPKHSDCVAACQTALGCNSD